MKLFFLINSDKSYSSRLVEKSFGRKEGLDYHNSYYPIFTKLGFRILIILILKTDNIMMSIDIEKLF